MVTSEQIRAFAAEFDPQPFHLDEETARDTFFGGLAASGWHTAALTMRLLVQGEPITLADGRTIAPDDVLGPLQVGTRLMVVGDTGRTDDLLALAKDVDGLVIESTYMDEEANMAKQFAHMTAKGAAELDQKPKDK